jgi:hypothetical protein
MRRLGGLRRVNPLGACVLMACPPPRLTWLLACMVSARSEWIAVASCSWVVIAVLCMLAGRPETRRLTPRG